VVCETCKAIHDPENCEGHTPALAQCGRRRPPDDELCFAHRRKASRNGESIENRLRREEARIANMADRISALPTAPTPPEAQPGLHNHRALPVDNPVIELSRMAGILRDAFEAAGARVNALTSLSVETRAGGEQLRGELVIWEKLIGHLRSTLVDMAKLGLDERLVRLEEKRADLVAEALFWFTTSAVQQLALDRPQRAQLESLMRETVERIVVNVDSTEPVQLVR